MSWLSQIAKGVGVGMLTGSPAGGLTAFFSDSFFAGAGVGMLDNVTRGALSYGSMNMWNGNFGYGGFYGGGHPMDFMGASIYTNNGPINAYNMNNYWW